VIQLARVCIFFLPPQDSLAASFKASSAAEVTDITNQLLAKLGDPYTRLLQGDDATALEAQEEGKVRVVVLLTALLTGMCAYQACALDGVVQGCCRVMMQQHWRHKKRTRFVQ
jgi:hypothetical protein